MAIYRFKDFYTNYRETFSDSEILNLDSYSLYTQDHDKIGSVKDALVDDSGSFRYLVADTGPWIFGKKVLIPIGLAHFNYDEERVYVDGLTKEQVENLPEYHDDMVVDEPYEKQVRDVYQPLASRRTNRQYLSSNNRAVQPDSGSAATASTYDYDREPSFYGMSDQDNHQQIKLYEERLVADKNRYKAGDVKITKDVQSKTSEVSVPIRNERVVIERNVPMDDSAAIGDRPDFTEGEVARVEVYEESADIKKQPFVREVVNVRKEVDHDTVEAKEQVRQENINIEKTGQPNINQPTQQRRNQR